MVKKDDDAGQDGADLADVAQAGLASVPDHEGGPMQGALDDTEYTYLKFNGMAYQTLTTMGVEDLGKEHAFTVRARVTGVGDQLLKDGQIRHLVTMEVGTVVMADDPNPVPPSPGG